MSTPKPITANRVEGPRGVRFAPPPGHRNLKVVLSYHGGAFLGYQAQPHGVTVQSVLTKSWEILTGESVTLYGCSRLDAGVHANEFVLNLYSASGLSIERLLRGLNGIILNHFAVPLCIYSIEETDPLFNARFDALGKHYRYLLWRGFSEHALIGKRSWHMRSRIEPHDLGALFKQYEGTHNFAAFRAQDCTAKTTVRTILRTECWQHPRFKECFIVDFWGEGFLKNMIRNIVGTTVDMATGRKPPSTIQDAFKHGSRVRIGQCAPAFALSLEKVFYDEVVWRKAIQEGAFSFIPC